MVSQRLRELRMNTGLTQNDIAKLLNITRSAYALYESGKRQLNYESVCIIADYYHVSLDYLYGRTDIPDEPCALSIEERSFLSDFRSIDVRGQDTVREVLNFEYRRQKHGESEREP